MYAGGPGTLVVQVRQQPVQLADGDRRRAGEAILLENRGTFNVYLGDSFVNASLGRPLTPLASISVAADREWWAIADPAAGAAEQPVYIVPGGYFAQAGTQELANVAAAAALSNGARLVDSPQLIDLALNAALPFVGPILDMRQWQSFLLSIQYEAANVAPPQNTGIVTLRWWDTAAKGNELGRQIWEINSVNQTDCGRTVITDQVRGPFMTVELSVGNGAASTMTYVLYGSNRPTDRSRVTELAPTAVAGPSSDRSILVYRNNLLPAGLTKLACRLGIGAATLNIGIGGAGGNINLRLYSPQLINTSPFPTFYSRSGMVGGNEFHEPITLPRRVLVAELNNTGGTTPDYNMSITIGDN